jgi:hypothetical protein
LLAPTADWKTSIECAACKISGFVRKAFCIDASRVSDSDDIVCEDTDTVIEKIMIDKIMLNREFIISTII